MKKKKHNQFIEFFRPTRWKIVILFILIITSLLAISLNNKSCDFGGCRLSKLDLVVKTLIINNSTIRIPDLPWLILEVLYLYFISILAYFIIIKVGENVKRK